MLHHDLDKARSGMHDLYGDHVDCACAQNVLVDMTYTLGEQTMSDFTSFNTLMKAGNWNAAADDLMYGTQWCRQVGKRCDRNVELIKSCNDKPKQPKKAEKPTLRYCESDLHALAQIARQGSVGFAPDGRSYSHVADFIDAAGLGGIKKGGFNDAIPQEYWSETLDFAEFLNYDENAERLGLKNIGPDIDNNPYNAPVGAIVVVHGVMGTSHVPQDDISVKGEGQAFYNGGQMGYGGSEGFPVYRTRGIFVPTKC
mmetsp:Transcript_28283/g.34988  ORF Transcript_28283/g.34988 Transcript_28283/m.34988 type:complete len:255 (+) Transcript_28283:784-1548(+)